MADSRKNIKVNPETFNRLSTLKTDEDVDWDTFLVMLADAYESNSNTDGANEKVLNRLDDLEAHLETLPDDIANDLASRFR